ARHVGGFTPFEADVTDSVHDGDNLLAVEVSDHGLVSDSLDKMSQYADFSLGGIIRKVTLFRVPEVHVGAIKLATRFDAAYRDATLEGTVAVLNESDTSLDGARVRFALKDAAGSAVPLEGPDSVPVDAGAWTRSEAAFSFGVRAPKKWDAEHPNLYTLATEIVSGGKVLQLLETRVGFRQTEVRGA